MRITVLQQQTKALQAERADEGTASSKQIESIKHLLWHGNVDEALDRIDSLFMDLDLISRQSAPAEKLAAGISDLRTYIGNNRGSIPNYGERYRQGETISTAFVESTINQVVSRRFVKKQQMQWTLKGAHLLLQTRTKVLNNELEDVFRRWYPKFRPVAQPAVPEQKVACPPASWLSLARPSRVTPDESFRWLCSSACKVQWRSSSSSVQSPAMLML